MNYDFEKLLVCPETKQALTRADKAMLENINARISNGEIKKKSGKNADTLLSDGLLRADGKVLYPISDGIPVMLSEEGLLI